MENQLVHIQNLIYEIRGQKVMLDFDLALLYQVETRRLNEAVKRNSKRFPPDFMFQLTKEEFRNLKIQFDLSDNGEILMSQFAISRWGGTRKLPYAFTEQGLAMLSGILNSDIAIETNIRIMRAFVAIRQLVLTSPPDRVTKLQTEMAQLKAYMEDVLTDQNDINENTRQQLELINQTLAEMQTTKRLPDKPRRKIGFFTDEQIANGEDIIE